MHIKSRCLVAVLSVFGWMSISVSGQTVGVGVPAASHYKHGAEWHAKKDYAKAIADYSEAIRIDPSYVTAYCSRALAWSEMKEFDKAIADNTESITLDPKHAWSYHNRGNNWAAKREFAKAIADYSEAIDLDPSLAASYKNRAWIWATCPSELMRDGKQAVESAKRGCELTDWKDPIYLDTLAAAFAEAGDFNAAVKTQLQAIDLVNGIDDRLESYRKQQRVRSDTELSTRLSQARPAMFASKEKSSSFFIVPYDAYLCLKPVGGTAGAVSEFGLGTSETEHTPIFTGLPRNPEPNREVKVGFVAAGSEIHFYQKTEWGGSRWAFSHDVKSEASRVAFQDRDNSLGRDGSAIEQLSSSKWLLHLDDAASGEINDDNDGDILIEIRLVPAKRPSKS